MTCLPRQCRRSRPAAGFTLVELLVVISIIAVLMGVLLPVLGSAREQAVRVQCQARLRSTHQLLHVYAVDFDQAVPLGYRKGRMQWNTMVFSGAFGPPTFTLFGRMYVAGLMDEPRVFYCPAETAPEQAFDTEANPWPPGEPGVNVQGGYASAPLVDWGEPDWPEVFPRLDDLGSDPVLADGAGLPERLDSRHRDGVHVLYADSAVRWIDRGRIEAPLSRQVGLSPANNPHQAAIWAEYALR